MGSDEVAALLLDTHVFIWLVSGAEGQLRAEVVSEIQAASRSGRLSIAAISIWEVAMLDARGRIHLGQDCLSWVRSALHRTGVQVVPLGPEIAIDSTRLPGQPHGDPADRLIISSARYTNSTLVTKDRAIIRYAGGGFVRVLEA
ncbi:MAG: type II toxin-antitoxin system VapC family toxin [Pseudomonadota bacterium]